MALTPQQFRLLQSLSPEEIKEYTRMRGGSGVNRVVPTGGGGGGGLIPRSGGVPAVRGNYPLSPNVASEPTMRTVRGRVVPSGDKVMTRSLPRLTGPAASRFARLASLGRYAAPFLRYAGPAAYAYQAYDAYDVATDEERQAEEEQRVADMASQSTGNEMFSGAGALEGVTNPFGLVYGLGALLGQADADLEEQERRGEYLDETQDERLAEVRARMASLQEERLNKRLSQLDEDYDPTKHDMYGTGLNDDYDPTKHDMYGTGLYDDYDPTKHDMYGSGEAEPEAKPKPQNRGTAARRKAADAVRSGEAEAAPPVAERISPEELEKIEAGFRADAMSLFKNTHGGDFDPKSDVDERKLQNMIQMFREDGGIDGRTANQVALEFYRRFPNRK